MGRNRNNEHRNRPRAVSTESALLCVRSRPGPHTVLVGENPKSVSLVARGDRPASRPSSDPGRRERQLRGSVRPLIENFAYRAEERPPTGRSTTPAGTRTSRKCAPTFRFRLSHLPGLFVLSIGIDCKSETQSSSVG